MSNVRRGFHAAKWDEPLLPDLSVPGARGLLPPPFAGVAELPDTLRRRQAPALPELAQQTVLRHYSRLSQQMLSGNVANDLTWGTTTRKYNPVVNERITNRPRVADLHPRQADDTVQGILSLLWELVHCLKALSGLAEFSLQPGGGAQGIYTNALIIRRYHEQRGDTQRDEIITTMLSHPTNPAGAAAAGFRVVELAPGPNGYPELDMVRAAISERTAGVMVSNPEDTGIFNPHIGQIVAAVHAAGGLCAYDQANANGLLGIARAREAGFDLCQFNLHKTFAAPMSLFGSGVGAVGASEKLARYLPGPIIVRDGDRYRRDTERPDSVGTVRAFLGNAAASLKAYAWIRALGLDGLRLAAQTAVLNNNYLLTRVRQIPGADISFPENTDPRIEQVRYTWEELTKDTGVTSEELLGRLADFGIPAYYTSHHPMLVPEPFSLEPSESFSKADLDEVADVLAELADEARTSPDVIRTAPHRAGGGVRWDLVTEETLPAMTWKGLTAS